MRLFTGEGGSPSVGGRRGGGKGHTQSEQGPLCQLVALHALEKVAKFGYRAMSQAPPLGRFGDQVQTQTQPYPIWLKTSCFGKMFSTPLCDPPTDAKSLSGFRSVYGRGHHLLPTYPAIKRYHW